VAELGERFVEANGLRFHVRTCEPEAGAADGRVALLLHGFPECAFSWRYQLPLLARLGWRAWAPDLRGYGQSDRPARVEDYAVERLLAANDYRAIREAFRGMARDPSRFPDEVLAVYRDQAARPGALTAMVHYYRALFRGGARRQRALGYPVIDVPTLLLWGEEDRALGLETLQGTERYVSDLTLRTLPGVSHWVQQEAPEQVNAMLEAWLLGKPVPQAAELR